MGRHRDVGGRRRTALIAGVALVAGSGAVAVTVAVTGAAGESMPIHATSVASAAAAPQPTAPAPTAPAAGARPRIPPIPGGIVGPAHAAPLAHTAPVPVRVRVPSIGVDSSLQPLGLTPNKELQKPTQWQVAGWYAGGVRPGDPGPAVIAGHVDSAADGPAIFYRLPDVKIGDVVLVDEQGGGTLQFVVDTIDRYPKSQFPTEAVYGPTPLPVLRLITCTGDFDRAARSYVDNLVVSAHLHT